MSGWPAASGQARVRQRLREVVREAPHSPFDLLGGSIAFGLGLYLIAAPDPFGRAHGLYGTLAAWADAPPWGFLFALCGAFGLTVAIWPERPPFGLRLLARMGVAFCLVAMAINHGFSALPSDATVTYSALSAASVWGIWRTKSNG